MAYILGLDDSTRLPKLWAQVSDSAPNDGDVLTWGGTGWGPVAPAGGSAYYTVLDSTASSSDINTALTDYDVVYLQPGNYTNATTSITLPNNKQLIGLSAGAGSSSAYMPQITLDTTTAYVTLGYNALVEGIRFVFGATTGSSFLQSTTDYNSRVRWCSFTGNGAGTAAYALSGSFKEISHVYMVACFGINVGYNQTAYGGTTDISNIWWSGHTTNTSSANVGLNITALATGSKLKVHDCFFYGGLRAVSNTSGSYCNFSNIVCDQQGLGATYSFYNTGTNNTFSNIHIRLANTGTVNGFYSEGSYNTYSGIYVHDASKIGINFNGGSHCVADAIYAFDCGDTATVQSGITFANNSYWVVGDVGSVSSGSHGVSISAVTYSTFGTIHATGNGGDGVNISGATHDCTFGNIQANDNTNDGVEVNGTTFYSLHFAGGTTSNNGAYGFIGGNGTTPISRIDAWMAEGNSSGQVSLGTNWASDREVGTATFAGTTGVSLPFTSSGYSRVTVKFWGRWTTVEGAQRILYAQPNGISTNSYRWASHDWGNDGGSWRHAVGAYGVALPATYHGLLEFPNWSITTDQMDVQGELTIDINPSAYSKQVTMQSNSVLTGRDADNKMNACSVVGRLESTATITSVTFGWTGGNFYGKAIAFGIK